MTMEQYYMDGYLLLEKLISVPSLSKAENRTADLLAEYMLVNGMPIHRKGNNVWTRSKKYDEAKPTLLLNSHHDTVPPTGQWTTDPFSPVLRSERLIGLGSNDAGASLVSMLMAMNYFHEADLPFNIVFAGTAEEEISGNGGIESVYDQLGKIDFAIVGEPTKMQVAVAEKGLLVLDCTVNGIAGHAARNEGINAIENAMRDIHWFTTYQFERNSRWLDKVKMTVTMINAGTQHNIVPCRCNFTVDIRVTDVYTLEEIISEISKHVTCEVTPRSVRLKPSGISDNHPLVITARGLNKELYGSPTSSDQALIAAPSIKMGPGDSSRSHTADEYIYLGELHDGISGYIEFIETLARTGLNPGTIGSNKQLEVH